MDTPASSTLLIRKYRKKLRQIENLERLNRPLTGEECIKVESKSLVREKLKVALDRLESEDEASSAEHNNKSYSTEDHLTADDFDSSGQAIQEVEVQSYGGRPKAEQISDSIRGSTDLASGDKNEKTDDVAVVESISPTEQPRASTKPKANDPSNTKPTKSNKSAKGAPQLSKSQCRVTYMDGHNDIITDLVVVDGRVVTASRDTCLKSWDITTGEELHTFGAHTDSVTCVIALDASCCQLIDSNLSSDDHLIVSGSFDCTYKLWSLNTGHLLKSVYTFNPLTKIAYLPSTEHLVTGSDGGKLELWSLASGENALSMLVFEGSVTGIVVSGDFIYSCCSDGTIKVYQLRINTNNAISLACLFMNDDVKTGAGRPLTRRHVRCMALTSEGSLLFGDDAQNLKLLDWKKDQLPYLVPGRVSKFPNHTSNYTSTDAVCCKDGYVITTSYDLDEGLGYVNVRKADTNLTYLATVDDHETERIICLDFCLDQSGNLVVVTGGLGLTLWHVLPSKTSNSDDPETIGLEFRQALSRPAIDSDFESEEEDDEDDEDDDLDDDDDNFDAMNRNASSQDSGWMSYCSVL